MSDKIDTSPEAVEQAVAELTELTLCRCHEVYTSRNLRDPDCDCDSADAVKTLSDRIAELEAKQRETHRDRDKWFGLALENNHRAEAANAKLEKAMAYIDSVGQNPFLQISVRQYARATLAEIKGETT